MKEKIVLEVKNVNHYYHNEMLIYNEAEKCWYAVSKEDLLKEISEKFDEFKKQINDSQENIKNEIINVKKENEKFKKTILENTKSMYELIEPIVKK